LSYYGSFDGALGFVIPVSAEKFKRLGKLEMRLNTAIPHAFGLNPKAFRLFHNQWKQVHNHNRRMMDGDLLWKFPFLDRNKQDECAALLGVNPDDIMDSLMELELATEFC
jgi:cleavage and polyadenylation specificity factor subunit 1